MAAIFLTSTTTNAQSSAFVTSGMGGGASSTARLSAIQTQQMNRINAAETCGSFGKFYGPAFAGDKDGQNCLNDLHIAADGNIGVGTPIPEEKLHVTGNVKVDGILTAAVDAPIENTDIANKEYVDTAVAAAGGGGGSLTVWGTTNCPDEWTRVYSGRIVAGALQYSSNVLGVSNTICLSGAYSFVTAGYTSSVMMNMNNKFISVDLQCAVCVK